MICYNGPINLKHLSLMKKTNLVDYHMHTPLCGHAAGQPEEYVRQAIALGLPEMGFSDHAPLIAHQRDNISMTKEELPLYHDMIRSVQERFKGRMDVKLGIEADFDPGFEDQTREMLAAFPYDYVIGSVHFIDQWGFDNPDEIQGWYHADVTEVYKAYYALLRQSASSGLFDIMGHVDLVKKFGHLPSADIQDEIVETARVFKESGVVIEINTAGLRKPVKEIYPSLPALKIYSQAGVPITFGSDAHQPSEVGMDFLQAAAWAREAGYSEYVVFRQRRIEKLVPLRKDGDHE